MDPSADDVESRRGTPGPEPWNTLLQQGPPSALDDKNVRNQRKAWGGAARGGPGGGGASSGCERRRRTSLRGKTTEGGRKGGGRGRRPGKSVEAQRAGPAAEAWARTEQRRVAAHEDRGAQARHVAMLFFLGPPLGCCPSSAGPLLLLLDALAPLAAADSAGSCSCLGDDERAACRLRLRNRPTSAPSAIISPAAHVVVRPDGRRTYRIDAKRARSGIGRGRGHDGVHGRSAAGPARNGGDRGPCSSPSSSGPSRQPACFPLPALPRVQGFIETATTIRELVRTPDPEAAFSRETVSPRPRNRLARPTPAGQEIKQDSQQGGEKEWNGKKKNKKRDSPRR
ncbi:hypothetical protein CDD83_5415 [Cordyceps sp. RAO-2017]|nr:hypothetical protein CDD83_5415 [Cordyceps sp. RAO-2017]